MDKQKLPMRKGVGIIVLNNNIYLTTCKEVLQNTNLKWFFFSSSSHVYKKSKKKLNENSKTEMNNKYSKTKLLAEKELLELKNKKICIGRYLVLPVKIKVNCLLYPQSLTK